MRIDSLRSFLVPGLLAVVAAALVLVAAGHSGPGSAKAAGTVSVWVATRDIAAGTSGSDAMRSLKLVQVPAGAVSAGAITARGQLADRIALTPVYKGDQVSVKRFAPLSDEGLSGGLRGTMRAVAVAGNAQQLLAGALHAGDRVDVVASLRDNATQVSYGRTVLRNLLVLQAPSSTDSGVSSASSSYGATLRVSDAQAQTLFFVTQNGNWTLSLRPAVHAANSRGATSSVRSILAGQGS
jgi:Flp pilus assembly protein CpaB